LIDTLLGLIPSGENIIRDLLFVSLTRIHGGDKYIGEIANPLLRAEALIHIGSGEDLEKLGSEYLYRMVDLHPMGVLIYLSKIDPSDIGLRLYTYVIKKAMRSINLLALAVSYTGSRRLYDIFTGIIEGEKDAKKILNISILLDAIIFRYSIDEVLPFGINTIENYMSNSKYPDILRRMLLSTLLACHAIRGEGDVDEISSVLIRGLRLSTDDPFYLQAAPIIAKNLYVADKIDLSKDIFYRLKELKNRMLQSYGPLSFITPTSPGKITRILNNIALIINSLIHVFNAFSRSERLIDNKFAIEYLGSLLHESMDPIILAVQTKFLIRENPHNVGETIDRYISNSDKILSKGEKYVTYRNLGQIYTLKSITDTGREHIESILLQKGFDIIQHFILGLYEESLRQYPISNNIQT